MEIFWDIGAEGFAFSHSSDLQSRPKSVRLVSQCKVQQIYIISLNQIHWQKNTQMHANENFKFLTQSIKHQLFPLFQ